MEAEEEDERHSGREVPLPDGMPAGWKAVERRHAASLQGRPGRHYVQYYSLDGRFKGLTLPDVFRADAQLEGYSIEEADSRYRAFVQRRKEQREADQARFVNMFGRIGILAAYLPGWKTWHNKGGKYGRQYYESPDGRKMGQIINVEAYLGQRMALGENLVDLIREARERAKSARPTDSTKSSSLCPGAALACDPALRGRRSPAKQAARWRRFLYVGRRRILPMAGSLPDSADSRLASRLRKRALENEELLDPSLGLSLEDERWIRTHPLWIKFARRGYPIPISEREVLALRAYTPTEYGGTADIRYCR